MNTYAHVFMYKPLPCSQTPPSPQKQGDPPPPPPPLPPTSCSQTPPSLTLVSAPACCGPLLQARNTSRALLAENASAMATASPMSPWMTSTASGSCTLATSHTKAKTRGALGPSRAQRLSAPSATPHARAHTHSQSFNQKCTQARAARSQGPAHATCPCRHVG